MSLADEQGGPSDQGQLSSDDSESYVEPEVVSALGSRDALGRLQGRASLFYSNGDRFEGRFRAGLREGRGRFHFADGGVLSGKFSGDVLEGPGESLEDGHCPGLGLGR